MKGVIRSRALMLALAAMGGGCGIGEGVDQHRLTSSMGDAGALCDGPCEPDLLPHGQNEQRRMPLMATAVQGESITEGQLATIEAIVAAQPTPVPDIGTHPHPLPGLQWFSWYVRPRLGRCDEAVRFEIELDLDEESTLQVLRNGEEVAAYGRQDNGAVTTSWLAIRGRNDRFDFALDHVPSGGRLRAGFRVTASEMKARPGCHGKVWRLSSRTVMIPAVGPDQALLHDLQAAFGELVFESDAALGLAQQSSQTPAVADPWVASALGRLIGLINAAGATPIPTAWDITGGGDPRVVILQLDSLLASRAETDMRPVDRYFFIDQGTLAVGNANPDGGGTCDYGDRTGVVCAAHPGAPRIPHGTWVARMIWSLLDGTGFSGAGPGFTRWHGGIPLDFTNAGHEEVLVAASDLIVLLDQLDPAWVDVITISAGVPFPVTGLREAFREFTDTGVIVAAAAGNDCAEAPLHPAAQPGVLAVGSSGRWNIASQSYSDLDQRSPIFDFMTGLDAGGCSNAGADVTAVGVGKLSREAHLGYCARPLAIAPVGYQGPQSGTECNFHQECPVPGEACIPSTHNPPFSHRVDMAGTSFATPQVAAAVAHAIADIRYLNPDLYGSLAGAPRTVVAAHVQHALLASATDLGSPGTGAGRIDVRALIEYLRNAEVASSIPNLVADHITDLDESIFPAVAQRTALGQTVTSFTVDDKNTFGHCLLCALLPLDICKIEMLPPRVDHYVRDYDASFEAAGGSSSRLHLEQHLRQETHVRIDLDVWGPIECFVPFTGPKRKTYHGTFAQRDGDEVTYLQSWHELEGLGYRRTDEEVANPPSGYRWTVTGPTECVLLPFLPLLGCLEDMVESELESTTPILLDHVHPFVQQEAMSMMTEVFTAHLFPGRARPMRHFENRLSPVHPAYGQPPLVDHLGASAVYRHLHLPNAPANHLNGFSRLPMKIFPLTGLQQPHFIDRFATVPAPFTSPIGTGHDAQIHYSSVLTDWQLVVAELEQAFSVAHLETVTTTALVPQVGVRATNIELDHGPGQDARAQVTWFAPGDPGAVGPGGTTYVGEIAATFTADFATCPVGFFDEPASTCGDPQVNPWRPHGELGFRMVIPLLRKNVYAAHPHSEVGAAGYDHRFELRETADWRNVRVEILTLDGVADAWIWDEARNDPSEVDLTRRDAALYLEQVLAPRMNRVIGTLSSAWWGLDGQLGKDRMTLGPILAFLANAPGENAWGGGIKDVALAGFDLDLTTFNGTRSEPEWTVHRRDGTAPTLALYLDLLEAPGQEAPPAAPVFDTSGNPCDIGDMCNPVQPHKGFMREHSIAVTADRCSNDPTVVCRDAATDCPAPSSGVVCVALGYCQPSVGQVSYPLSECPAADIGGSSASCAGSEVTGQCVAVPARARFAHSFVRRYEPISLELAEARDDVYVTGYAHRHSPQFRESAYYVSDLWLFDELMAGGNADVILAAEPVHDPARRPYTLIGFLRHAQSLIRSDACLQQFVLDFTYDRFSPQPNCSSLGAACSSFWMTYRKDYRLTQTTAARDAHGADVCSSSGSEPPLVEISQPVD